MTVYPYNVITSFTSCVHKVYKKKILNIRIVETHGPLIKRQASCINIIYMFMG